MGGYVNLFWDFLRTMKIVADENIPLLQHYFSDCAELIIKPGREISHADVVDADVLLVRSVTSANEKLLKNTSVRFVGSATIGHDHLDIAWLDANHIIWSVAKGCNAVAVVEYIICVIAALQKRNLLTGLRAGVVGVGDIGGRVVDMLRLLGFNVVMYDPFRVNEKDFLSTPLAEFSDLDLITLHMPLTQQGPFPTYHLIEKNFLQQQKENAVLINTARGAVLNSEDFLTYGKHLLGCFDVWENEPDISLDMLKQAVIATPHIAGYSVQSKYRGIQLLYEAMLAHHIIQPKDKVSVEYPRKTIIFENAMDDWRDAVLKVFDPWELSLAMKREIKFDERRKLFNDRCEFSFVSPHPGPLPL